MSSTSAVAHTEDAVGYANEARRHTNAVEASPAISFLTVFESLAYIRALPAASLVQRVKLRIMLRKNLRKLRKWAQHAPENILHRYDLIQAELASHFNQDLKAMQHYEDAIKHAWENGYLNDLALANELAGRFYLAGGKPDLAMHYLANAANNYKRWGAANKVRWLLIEFPELAAQSTLSHTPRGTFSYGSDSLGAGHLFDLETVINASQILAGEIVLENLLERLMQVSLINAGGDKASLILNRDDQLTIEITTWVKGTEPEFRFESVPLNEATHVPVSVIQYVARTLEDLVLNNAVAEDIFTQDEYVLREKPKSILCIPVQSQSHLTGILYVDPSKRLGRRLSRCPLGATCPGTTKRRPYLCPGPSKALLWTTTPVTPCRPSCLFPGRRCVPALHYP